MSGLLAFLAGFAVGSLPTAGWIAAAAGVDLRKGGSGNPGAANALRLGGARLGAAVLVAEVAKGAAVVAGALLLDGDRVTALAGVGAVWGNVLNPWYRLRGGQGLGISAGVLLAAWPIGLVAGLAAVVAGLGATRSSRPAALAAVATLVAVAVADPSWAAAGWGLDGEHALLALGLGGVVAGKQAALILAPPPGTTPPSPPAPPAGA